MDPIQIDYDHIDVSNIMDQIKVQIAERPKASPLEASATAPGRTVR